MELRYWALLIFLGSIWGSAFMFIKIATPELGAVFLVQLRLALASLVFLPLLLRNKQLRLFKKSFKYILILSLTNTAIPFVLFSEASKGSDSNMLAILNSSTALMTMLIALFWLKEKVISKQVLGLLIGFIGIIILVNPSNSSIDPYSAAICLTGSFCYAFSGVFIQKYCININKMVLIGWSLIFGTILLLPISLFNLPTSFPSNNAILSVLWLGVVSTGLSFIGYVRLIEKVGAVKTSTVAYFLPVFGIIWGNIFLDELVSFLIIVGCIMVLIGVFFATSNDKNLEIVDGK